MDSPPELKKNWIVTQEAFDRMLLQLDPERERAGRVYEQIRQKLTKFFEWRNCVNPEEHADRTIDRVARRIAEGAQITTGNPYLFFHGVAVNVLREHWKEVQRADLKPLDEVPEIRTAAGAGPDDERVEKERSLECLDGCVQKLPAQQLVIITEYHQGQGGEKIARRNELAKQLNIPLNALRIRAFRIRGELEICISDCTRRKAG